MAGSSCAPDDANASDLFAHESHRKRSPVLLHPVQAGMIADEDDAFRSYPLWDTFLD